MLSVMVLQFFSFGLTVSRVGFSVFSIQVNIASTEMKTRLATLTYDFCTPQGIFFSDLTFWTSFSCRK
jgi:hypothetical protein